MELAEIAVKTEKGGERILLTSGRLVPRQGLEGDFRGGNHPRMISLLPDEARQAVGESPQIGLCVQRFSANLITRGLDPNKLHSGQSLQVGGCLLEITQVGKKCFPDCPLVQQGSSCPLSRSCLFARVIQGGPIVTGDPIVIPDP